MKKKKDDQLYYAEFYYAKTDTPKGLNFIQTEDAHLSDFSVYYSGSDWMVKEGNKTFLTMGTISLDINEIRTMASGSCAIHKNELNINEEYAVCKEGYTIKIFPVKE